MLTNARKKEGDEKALVQIKGGRKKEPWTSRRVTTAKRRNRGEANLGP